MASWLRAFAALGRDVRVGARSLLRAKGLSAIVVVTLALGIGANAAIFSVVRSVLLRPLVNREADRLLYIRQTAPGIGTENLTFSMPEIADLEARVESIAAFGDFSTVDFTLAAPGEAPRVVKAGVVNGSFFEVMGLRPALGRLLNAGDDGPKAAGAVVLTHPFWTAVFHRDPAVIGKTLRLGPGTATVVGVLEPSLPYPVETNDVHPECEMIVALAKGGRNIPVGKALDCVFGYGVGFDVTRRDMQSVAKDLRRPWSLSKDFDASAPCGPLAAAARIGHPAAGAITLDVNGERRQEGDLNQMIWKVPEVIAVLSEYFELRPGDLILTGTPSGVGAVERGDLLEGRIEGVGTLTVTIGPPA